MWKLRLYRWDFHESVISTAFIARMDRKSKYSRFRQRPVVIIQHSAQTLSALGRTRVSHMARLWSDQLLSLARAMVKTT